MSTTYTTNYHLGKQEDTSDNFNMSVITDNMDIIDTALSGKVDKETGKGLSTNDYTTAEKTKLAGIAEGAEGNVQSNWTQTTTTADDYIKNKPTLGTAAAKNATDTYNATGTDVTTGKAVAAALTTLPEPMVFKGSLGTGGTITTLPTASSTNKGYVYKVITAGTYASQSAKVGDTFISDGSAWVLIPSGDEPSGTVTNVAVANGGGLTVSGSPVTSSGTITVGHSNSVTAKTSSSIKKFTYDAYGHVTGSSELSTAESNALASGIDSTKVAQIETNENNILLVANQSVNYNVFDIANTTVTPSTGASVVKTNNTITVTSTSGNAYAHGEIYIQNFKAGTYYFSCKVESLIGQDEKHILVRETIPTGNLLLNLTVSATGTIYGEFTVSSDITLFIGIYSCYTSNSDDEISISDIAIIPKSVWDSGFTSYQPYAMSNAELTAKEQQNENNISIIDILSTVTAASGYTIDSKSTLYKQGKHVFGNLIIQKSTAYSTTQYTAATLTYKPAKSYLGGAFLSPDWGVTDIGYVYIHPTSGELKLQANPAYSGSDTYMYVPLDFVTA